MAGSFSDTAETAILNAVFRAQAWANMLDNAASSPATTFDISLHTAAGADGDAHNANETTYTGYARVSIGRTTGAWNAPSSGLIDNVAAITFGACTSGTPTIQSFKIIRGATEVIAWGDLTASLAVSPGITPQFAAGALDITLT